ncbi:MAG TPA: glycoside hydrolase family 43 protein [Bacteroidales bacterium]|nr:glycoside hydrolase family 43 protein [Bacteroidales bacterium]
MKKMYFPIFSLLLLLQGVLFPAGIARAQTRDAYLLYYFEGQAGEHGGLYVAYSHDLQTWHKLASGIFNPELGEWKVFRDPSVIRTKDGSFHIVWTCGESGFGYASSEDGLHWANEKFVTVSNPGRGQDFVNVWAPEFYAGNDSLYVIWSSTLKKDYTPPGNPDKWWTAVWNHRFYISSTKDFKTFTPARKFWDPGFNAIDATIYKTDSLYYIFFKDERKTGKNIVLAHSRYFEGPFHGNHAITQRFTEGAIVIPADTALVLYYDSYDKNKGYRYITSHNMEDWSSEITPEKVGFKDVFRHGSIVKIPEPDLEDMLKAMDRGSH